MKTVFVYTFKNDLSYQKLIDLFDLLDNEFTDKGGYLTIKKGCNELSFESSREYLKFALGHSRNFNK